MDIVLFIFASYALYFVVSLLTVLDRYKKFKMYCETTNLYCESIKLSIKIVIKLLFLSVRKIIL